MYLVEEHEDSGRARRLAVRPGATVGALMAVEPLAGEDWPAGARLIVEGAHFLDDGDPVNAVSRLEGVL